MLIIALNSVPVSYSLLFSAMYPRHTGTKNLITVTIKKLDFNCFPRVPLPYQDFLIHHICPGAEFKRTSLGQHVPGKVKKG
jgi:hypothetical protein